jgi:hypothetical protein
MRETTAMQWRISQETSQREAAWMFTRTIDSFEQTLDGFILEILKAETQT